jgi:hypothetical protein
MSIFKYDNFKQWERFSEMPKGINRYCGATKDDTFIRATMAELPEHLADEAGVYLLAFAIGRLSKPLLAFVTELGVMDRPSVKNSLDVALLIRDTMFSKQSKSEFADSPYLEILKQTAEIYGAAFAVDSMEAVYNDEFAMERTGASFFANGAQKLESYSANLKLFMSFTPPQFLASPDIGNIGIRNISHQIVNFDRKDPLVEHLEILGQLSFDDLSSITKVIKDDSLGRSAFIGRQIDAAVCKDLPDMKSGFVYNLPFALEARPMNTLMTLIAMNELELSRFISSGSMESYLTSKWIHAGNAHTMEDQNFLILHDLFNQRLLANPFFERVFQRTESLYKPSFVSVTMAFLSQAIKEKGLAVEMVKAPGGSKNVSSGVLKSFAEGLGLIAKHAREPEVVQAGHAMVTSQLRINLINLYVSMANDEDVGKKLKKPDAVDVDYQFKFMAVRLCAELHQPNQNYTSSALAKIKPIGNFVSDMAGLNHREALLMLVSTYDEETILDALKDYKPGIKPMIELGVLSQKHIKLLPAKERGEMLETAMGL